MSKSPTVEMDGVREYGSRYLVELSTCAGRVVIVAANEGGYCSTLVDLLDVVEWIEKNREAVESLKAVAREPLTIAA